LSLYRLLHHLTARGAIIRMHTFLKFTVGDLIVWWELEELTNFVGDPDPVGGGIKLPHAELRRFGGKGNALLDFMQRSLLPKQFCDINTRADVTGKLSLCVVARDSVV
jgi:hypothetical protein